MNNIKRLGEGTMQNPSRDREYDNSNSSDEDSDKGKGKGKYITWLSPRIKVDFNNLRKRKAQACRRLGIKMQNVPKHNWGGILIQAGVQSLSQI